VLLENRSTLSTRQRTMQHVKLWHQY
jgi:hypothetical protein